jgi:hypothetical protein
VPAVHLRSLAVVVLLLAVAVAGTVIVRELTEPVPAKPIAPISIDPDSGVQAGESTEDDEPARRQRRKRERDRDRRFQPPPSATPEPDARAAPDTPPPQIEVPTPPSDDDDGGED